VLLAPNFTATVTRSLHEEEEDPGCFFIELVENIPKKPIIY
jgi:hypothetical protein